MAAFQDRHFWKRVAYSRLTAIILGLAILGLGRTVWQIGWRSRAVDQERQRVAAELAELLERERALKQEIAALETDRGIEAAIRQKFPVVRDGERVIVVVEEEAAPQATTTPATTGWRGWLAGWLEF
jgi:cell division protein FtsB